MKKHLVIVTERPEQQTIVRNLAESARHALETIPGVSNCRLLKATPGEAILSFETEKQEWPPSIDDTLSDLNIALVHAEFCDWHT